jgi:hypothetical protein
MNRRKASPLARWAATLAGAALAPFAPVAAQPVSPAEAPADWVAYAESTTLSVTEWLQASSEPATRLRAYLDATRPGPDQASPPLMLKLWIDGKGVVSRVEFPPFAEPEPNADLRDLIIGRRLGAAPPKHMLLPLRIAVQLDAPAMVSAPAT